MRVQKASLTGPPINLIAMRLVKNEKTLTRISNVLTIN